MNTKTQAGGQPNGSKSKPSVEVRVRAAGAAPTAKPSASDTPLDPDPHVWVKKAGIKTTAEVAVPSRLVDQVIGQEEAVGVALKAAEQRRHLLLIGDPGTGKSMLAKAMAEILPRRKENDLLVAPNPKNPNEPVIAEVAGGQGRTSVEAHAKKTKRGLFWWKVMEYAVAAGALVFGLYMWIWQGEDPLFFLFVMLLALLFLYFSSQRRPAAEALIPKLLIERSTDERPAPYVDGTGSHAGALLGDVRHDPYQSGGLETPSHQRVEVGAIHRAHNGVLFIDEINVLRLPSQQALLTALQERKYAIVGQSQSSAGAMVRTQPVPCDFILVAAGNLDAIQNPEKTLTGDTGMHPALRSRIRGYGYEVFVNNVMEDNQSNRMKLLQFVAQEVMRDGRIPHFEAGAAAEVIREAQRRSGEVGKLTLRLRELGGLVRTAGDYARLDNAPFATLDHVRQAKSSSRSLEQQITASEIRRRLSGIKLLREGTKVGRANGSGSIGTGEVGEPAGIVIPVEAVVTPALSRHQGNIHLSQVIADARGRSVENVRAVLKGFRGADISNYDVHITARITHPDADAEGIGIAAAIAAISALEGIAVRQDIVAIGSVGVTGEVEPVAATLQQIEYAAALGFGHVLVPEDLRATLLLEERTRHDVQVTFCRTLQEAAETMLETGGVVRFPARPATGSVRASIASAKTALAESATRGKHGSRKT